MKKALFFVAAALMGLAVNAQQRDTIFFEDFEGVSVTGTNMGYMGSLPSDWVVYEDNNNNHSNYTSFGKGWIVYDLTGASKCALSISYLATENVYNDRWLITPQFNVPASGYKLFFEEITSGYYEGLAVLVSTTDSAKESFTDTLMCEFPTDDAMRYFDLSAYAGEDIRIAFVNNALNYYCMFIAVDNIIVTNYWPNNDIILYKNGAQRYAQAGGSFNVNTVVYNNGIDTLRSFDLVYSINGGASQTYSLNNQSIAPFTYDMYSIPCSATTVGEANVVVTAENPNGVSDEIPSNNTVSFASIQIYDPSTTVQRISLLDHFTTARCQYCPLGHERLEQAIVGFEDKIAWVAHHLGYYEDPMLIDADYQLYNLYGGGSWAPAFALDRDSYYAPDEDGVIGSVGAAETMANYFLDATNVPTYLRLNLVKDNYDPQSRELTVTVSGEFIDGMDITSPRVTIYAIEDGINYRQQSTDGMHSNYTHNHVARAIFSGTWGDADVITSTGAGDTFTKTYTITLPAKCHADKVSLVAFVSNYSSSVKKRNVVQAAKTGYIFEGDDPTQSNVSIDGIEANVSVSIYPNPVSEIAYINADGLVIRSYSVVNTLGQKVIDEQNVNVENIELNVSNMSQGVYFINLTTDKGIATERMTVVK